MRSNHQYSECNHQKKREKKEKMVVSSCCCLFFIVGCCFCCLLVALLYCGFVVLWFCCSVVLLYCGFVVLWFCCIVVLLFGKQQEQNKNNTKKQQTFLDGFYVCWFGVGVGFGALFVLLDYCFCFDCCCSFCCCSFCCCCYCCCCLLFVVLLFCLVWCTPTKESTTKRKTLFYSVVLRYCVWRPFAAERPTAQGQNK